MPRTLRLVLLALLGVASLAAGCGKTADESVDAGSTSGGVRDGAIATSDGATDAAIAVSDSSVMPKDASVMPPNVSCTTEDASACTTLPPSVCSADNTQVVFFGGGACVDGACTWTQSAMACGSQSHCMNGGCTPPTTK